MKLHQLQTHRHKYTLTSYLGLVQLLSLEETLRDTEGRYGRELSRLNRILQQLESELSQVRDQVERQSDDYQALLNVKMKLEAEIEGYRSLLHGLDT